MNLGQLSRLVRAEFLVDAQTLTKIQGMPFRAAEIESAGSWRCSMTADAERPIDHAAMTRKDWSSDQEVRWCPGCGDYSILTAVQMLHARARRAAARTRCSCRASAARAGFPYYMNTYGMHTIHGRAPAIATGLAVSRPDLDVWVITGDGDALSIGGNHLIHALRRNVNLTILLFNNQIYGLTKGQYSPTSEVGKVTKSTPFGSVDHPFNPISLALGAEATFVARTHDMDRKHMMETFRRAHEHQGAAFVEVYQNCNVFNDGAFEQITAKDARPKMLIRWSTASRSGSAPKGSTGVVLNARGEAEIVDVADVGEDRLLVHDEHRDDPSAGVRAVPPGRHRRRADADRRVPGRRSARLRGRGAAAARSAPRSAGPRRPRGAARVRRHLGGRRLGRGYARLVEAAEHDPVRGFGEKNVVFSGMRTPAKAAARICATVTGRNKTAVSASPFSTNAATAAALLRNVTVAFGSAGRTEASNRTESTPRSTSGMSVTSCVGWSNARLDRSISPSASSSCIRARSSTTRWGCWRRRRRP